MNEVTETKRTELSEYKKDLSLDIINETMALGFTTIGKNELAKISTGMVDVRRNMEVYGRRNSQVTSKLMSLTMLKHGPYGALKQCDAQIKNKYEAVKENWFKLQETKNDVEKWEKKLDSDELDEHERRQLEIKVFKGRTGLHDAGVHIEHAYKEMLMYMECKSEIMEANDIPEEFDEGDYIDAEVKENLTTAFQHALRDLQVSGAANMGTLEYLEQFGVNPTVAYAEARKYLAELNNNPSIDVQALYDWYDEMYEKYKDEYKKAMKRLGITNLMTDEVTYRR